MVSLYFLVFIHIGSRRIWISPCTANPTGEWTAQQARNSEMYLQDEKLQCQILQRDRDTKYVAAFDQVFTTSGREIKVTPIKSPNLQAFVERVIQTIKHEVLNAFCVVSEEHLNYILRTTQQWYNYRRGHSGRDYLPPMRTADSLTVFDFAKDKVECREELGGQLKSYHCAA